ncbi:DUF4179 domain-containing protein [Paenibacillus allorhizosphaerae]|uniref:DUF4179 domain-containing protein n=1 Tax=Paenibacillus allorhizosphaerae TaxID=2849866 RepID=A0ABN7TVA3_9BACL|nr:DUF4179 domain-containing protein [Paenibacillus allorhizosphaerae]CAG7653511.1 hypothetical protein PAECIP111802_05504 [Paenibacillus allorhizosphaerae]
MECMKSEQLEAYLHDRLDPHESRRLEEHAEHCAHCQEQIARKCESLPRLVIVPAEPIQLAAAFVAETISKAVKEREKRGLRTAKRRRLLQAAALSVIGLFLAASLTLFLSPAFADYVKSFFLSGRGDQGLKRAAEQGLSKPLELKIADQGITIHIKEVLADTERIAVVCDVTDEQSRSLVGRPDLDLTKHIKLTDETGSQQIGSWSYVLSDGHALLENEIGKLQFRGELPDKLVVQMNYSELGGVKGRWEIAIDVDLTRAKAASRTVAIHREYTSPQGRTFGLQRVDVAPSGIGVVVETNDADGITNYAYRLLDEQGQTLRVHEDFYGEEGYKSGQLTARGPIVSEGSRPGVKQWSDLFQPLTDKEKKRLVFKLDAFYYSEKVEFSQTIEPPKMMHEPVALDLGGNRIVLNGFRIKKDKEKESVQGRPVLKPGAIMEYEATLDRDVVGLRGFTITDESGNRLPLSNSIRRRTKEHDGIIRIQGFFLIPDIAEVPKQWTLAFDKLDKQERVQWEVPVNLEQ